ncbi:hypothetical protein EAF04_003951 [Stromatinia cepivora]|nr:hypothetical protein EAF04_003951 [Stromatinia cepivora]
MDLFSENSPYQRPPHHTPPLQSLQTLQTRHLTLPFPCPFCTDPNLHTLVPAGSGILVIMTSSESADSEPESGESSSSVFSSQFSSPYQLPPSPLYSSSSSYPSTPFQHSFSPSSCPYQPPPNPRAYTPPLSQFNNNTWKILRICGVEDITTSEWTQGISPAENKNRHKNKSTNPWTQHPNSHPSPQQSHWKHMSWIPRPIGNISMHSLNTTHNAPRTHMYNTQERNNNNNNIHITQKWTGNTGEDANGFGYRGRMGAQSRLAGMMSLLGAVLGERGGRGRGIGI